MIDFFEFAKKFNKPGLWLDMLAQVAQVQEIRVRDDDKLLIYVVAARNLGKPQPPDEYIFGPAEAEKYQIEKWTEAAPDEVARILARLGKSEAK